MGIKFNLKRIVRFAVRVREKGIAECSRFILFRFFGPIIYWLFRGRAKKQIATILQKHHKVERVFVIKSTLDFSFPYDQRPHHLARALANAGDLVFFVPRGAGYDQVATILHQSELLYVSPHLELLLELCSSPTLMVFSTDMDLNAELLDRAWRNGFVVYDYIDAIDTLISSGPVTKERLELHSGLLARQDDTICLASSAILFEEISNSRQQNCALVENAADNSHFRVNRSRSELDSRFLEIIDQELPIAGYYGALASWLDYEILVAAAELQPSINFVVIGVDFDGSVDILADAPSNIHVLPPIDYRALPQVAIWFDVALLPFKRNHITDATSPLKFFEYMALGLPVVSTKIQEVERYNCVTIADTVELFAAAVANEAISGNSDRKRRLVLAEAAQNDWSKRANIIQNTIRSAMTSSPITQLSWTSGGQLIAPEGRGIRAC